MAVFATCLGYPRIGVARELKRALESYWARKKSGGELLEAALELRRRHWLTMKAGGSTTSRVTISRSMTMSLTWLSRLAPFLSDTTIYPIPSSVISRWPEGFKTLMTGSTWWRSK